MAALKYWIWLSTRKGLTPGELVRVAEHFGSPELAYYSDPVEYEQLGLRKSKWETLLDKSLEEAEEILGNCDRLGVSVLTLQDADYPERLRQIYDPPCVLYLKGKLPAVDEWVSIGVVGPRKPSVYGVEMATQLGMDLARGGVLLISGLAQGIDAVALTSALRNGGTVISVLGCGVDICYPTQNAQLYQDIAASGVLVSEYPPGTSPEGWRFPARNRILSGLCLGVVAVEGSAHSGALITARHALDQNRDVYVFPAQVNTATSTGTNRMLERGEAQCILSAQLLLREYAERYPGFLKTPEPLPPQVREERTAQFEPQPLLPPTEGEGEKNMVDKEAKRAYITLNECKMSLSDDEQEILLALQDGPLHPDELVERMQAPARRVLSALTMLQVQGMVEEGEQKRFFAAVAICDG